MSLERVVRWVARQFVAIPVRFGLVAGAGLIAVAFTDAPAEMRVGFAVGGLICIASTLSTWQNYRREERQLTQTESEEP